MERNEYLSDPVREGLVAGGITAGYIHIKTHLKRKIEQEQIK